MPALLVAVLALVIAVSSSATAALVITGKQIKNNSVTTKDIKDGNLKTADLSAAAKAELKGNAGPAGPAGEKGATGATGPAGPTGATGPSGIGGYQTILNTANIAAGSAGTVTATCPAGKKPIGGGGLVGLVNNPNLHIELSAPTTAGGSVLSLGDPIDSWSIRMRNEDSAQRLAWVVAVCANVS